MVETPPRAGPSPPHGPARFLVRATGAPSDTRLAGTGFDTALPQVGTGRRFRARMTTLWETLGVPGVGFAPGDRHTDQAAARTDTPGRACPIHTEGLTNT